MNRDHLRHFIFLNLTEMHDASAEALENRSFTYIVRLLPPLRDQRYVANEIPSIII